jgi:hypothetical protein
VKRLAAFTFTFLLMLFAIGSCTLSMIALGGAQ